MIKFHVNLQGCTFLGFPGISYQMENVGYPWGSDPLDLYHVPTIYTSILRCFFSRTYGGRFRERKRLGVLFQGHRHVSCRIYQHLGMSFISGDSGIAPLGVATTLVGGQCDDNTCSSC